jgi:hypothetical protein
MLRRTPPTLSWAGPLRSGRLKRRRLYVSALGQLAEEIRPRHDSRDQCRAGTGGGHAGITHIFGQEPT